MAKVNAEGERLEARRKTLGVGSKQEVAPVKRGELRVKSEELRIRN